MDSGANLKLSGPLAQAIVTNKIRYDKDSHSIDINIDYKVAAEALKFQGLKGKPTDGKYFEQFVNTLSEYYPLAAKLYGRAGGLGLSFSNMP